MTRETRVPPGRYEIARLGAHGDGIAGGANGDVYVPFALPGETADVPADGGVSIVGAVSSERAVPPCRHFGVCGGCVAQHMRDDLYARWKEGIVREAFAQRGLADAPIGPLVHCAPASRRRAVLTAVRRGDRMQLGYHGRRSHDLVEISECSVLRPAIVAEFDALTQLTAALNVDEARLTVLATASGLDVAVTTDTKRIAPRAATAIGRIAGERRFARVTVNGDAIAARSQPILDMAGAQVVPPPGAFVQAVEAAEAVMREGVLAAIPKAKRVADLFCGLGAFTYALALRSRVLSADNDRAALAALDHAVRNTQGLKPVEILPRDLFRDPLSPRELEDFDAVVLDPPRAGAQAQTEALARAVVPTVVYVSCNPATLARDTRLLIDGGYTLESVTPIDQFLYSDHVEAMAVFRRPSKKRKG
jgi:23S rRNA (uracil1939-C5)-methyltransferase